ncbi:MAG: MBG domain-containing protein [Kiritimatiellia bacterium]
MEIHPQVQTGCFANVCRKVFFGLVALAFPLTAAAAPTAKNGDGTLSVAPATVAAASAGNRLEFQFRNENRGAFYEGSQLELSVPAGWSAPQTADSAAPGYVEVCGTSGAATAAISSVSGSGPWQVTVEFTAAKGNSHGFGLAFGSAAPTAAGAHAFAARTRQAGGNFVALGASPVVAVTSAPALVTLGDLLQDYDGTPRAVAVQTEPAGLAVAVTYDGSPAAPIAPGIYAVVATVVEPGYEGSAVGTLVVREAGSAEPVVGLETFENFAPAGSGYESGMFLGQDGSVWTYAKARGDLSIADRSPTLEKAKGAFIRSGTIPGGVGTLALKYRRAGNQGVACGVYVNGAQVGTVSGGDGSVQTWTSAPVNVAGDVVLMFTNSVNAGAITLDDVEWTDYRTPAAVALAELAQTYDGTPRTAVATTEPAGLAVAITYDGSPSAPTAAGTYAVVATVADDVYAGSASGTLVVAQANQTLDFAAIADPAEFQTLNLAAAASSGLPVAFAVGFGPAAIAADGTSVSFSGTGRVAIVASQAGDGNWNAAPVVAREFEVLPALALSADSVNVRENGEGRLFVRLNGAPASNLMVSVARVGGDVDLRVKSGAALAFGPANWDWWQAVTLAATNDDDKAGGTATFRVALPGREPRMVAAKELDDDVAENLARATNGATISGGVNAAGLIDGIHASFFNYGYLVWTNAAPQAMTLALKAPSAVSRIRLLNWNWLYPVLHRYRIESSLDGTNWTLLVDASAEDRHGWDDWEIPEQAVRYLRLTGLANSANQMVCIPEWEVYGKRLPAPANVVLQNLRQTYDGRPKQVAVQTDPPDLPVEVAYENATARRRSEPVPETATEPPVAAGVYVVMAEVADDEYVGYAEGTLVVEKAIQTLAFPNPGAQSEASLLELRAEASSGLPVSYAVTAGPATLDETGSRLIFSGTGAVSVVASQAGDDNWDPAADVSVSFDVSAGLCIEISQADVNVRENGEGRFFVRLNMDPGSSRVVALSRVAGAEEIAIRSRTNWVFNSANWSIWQPVTLAAPNDANATSETATVQIAMAGLSTRFVTATTLDDDVGENLALASGGATIARINASRPELLIDGIHAVSTNYGHTVWTANPRGAITLDLKAVATVSRVRLLNWDWTCRYQRYQIEASPDGTNWTLLAASSIERHGWDDWAVADQSLRFLRFTGLSNSANQCVVISELEVYGTRAPAPAPARRSVAVANVAAPAAPEAVLPGGVLAEPEPVLVLTSAGAADETGWNAVDGDDATAWVGQKAGGGYVVIQYQPALELSALEVDLAEGSLTNVQYLYSSDAQNWQPLPDDMESNPISLHYLWLVFPGDGTAAVPHVLEIVPNP